MFNRPSVLCPVDFSDASRGALRYAGALAEHFYADLTVLTVHLPLLADAAAAAIDGHWMEQQTRAALATFVQDAFPARRPQVPELRMEIAIGRPAVEILRVAARTHADVIVMSTRGTGGFRKMLFGSVTERVLRNTHVPVVITPATGSGPDSLEVWRRGLKRMLVPVDFTGWTPRQVTVARGLAEALNTEIVFAHVLSSADPDQRLEAHHKLDDMIRSTPATLRPAMTLGVGDAAAEIARIAKDRAVDVIVMALHSSPGLRHHMGHVAYAILCQTPTLVVAWPPAPTGNALAPDRAGGTVIV